MELSVQILLFSVSFICFLGGVNLLIKGARPFLPDEEDPSIAVVDNLIRFLSGIYFSIGFLFLWVANNIKKNHAIIYFLGLIVLFSGIGRMISYLRVGSAGKYYTVVAWIEILLGIMIIILQIGADRLWS